MTKEDYKLLPLATVGFGAGLYKYYVRPELTAKRMWLAIGAAVTAYELACPDNELLSEGVDRAIDKHPVAVPLAIGVTALHLMNVLPQQIDPFSQGLKLLKGR